MSRRDCPALGVPAVSRAIIRARHFAIAQSYDRERLRMVLEVAAARKGNVWAVAS